ETYVEKVSVVRYNLNTSSFIVKQVKGLVEEGTIATWDLILHNSSNGCYYYASANVVYILDEELRILLKKKVLKWDWKCDNDRGGYIKPRRMLLNNSGTLLQVVYSTIDQYFVLLLDPQTLNEIGRINDIDTIKFSKNEKFIFASNGHQDQYESYIMENPYNSILRRK
ncbi:MAG: hypothetical protein ACRCWQ_04565, partial [Bacilli bacterium]